MSTFIQPLVVTLILFAVFTIRGTASELCEGQARNVHDKGDYQFATNSKVYKGNGVHIYETCVANLSERDTEFDWFIPGPNTWIPPQEQAFAKRTFNSRDTLESALSCMEYGNVSATDRFTYLGHASDKDALEREKSTSCSRWVSQDSSAVSDGEPSKYAFSIDFNLFIPTDKKNPEETMMRFVGEASLFFSEGEPVTTQIAYQFVPYKGRQGGKPKEVAMRPVDGGSAGEVLRIAFNTTYSKSIDVERGMPLSASDKYSLQYEAKPDFQLTSTRYGFYDKNNQFVGAVFVPVLAPRRLQ